MVVQFIMNTSSSCMGAHVRVYASTWVTGIEQKPDDVNQVYACKISLQISEHGKIHFSKSIHKSMI